MLAGTVTGATAAGHRLGRDGGGRGDGAAAVRDTGGGDTLEAYASVLTRALAQAVLSHGSRRFEAPRPWRAFTLLGPRYHMTIPP